VLPWRMGDLVAHYALRLTFELAVGAGHERAIRDEPIKWVPHEGELEEGFPILGRQVGPDLLETEMAVLQLCQLRDWQFPPHEESHLFHVLWAHVLAKCSPNGMRSGFRNGDENEFVQRGDDHRPVNFGGLFSRKAATP